MANTKEIKNRIKSVHDTQKITNAMYLIASTKMQKAKKELEMTKPYFNELRSEIKRIFRKANNVNSIYFYPKTEEIDYPGTYGILVITADKGLAGAYNQNVLKEVHRLVEDHDDVKLFVVGEYGRHYFESHDAPIEESFHFTAQNPTLERAREISGILLEKYLRKEIVKLFVIFTDFANGFSGGDAKSMRLLPFHRDEFSSEQHEVGGAGYDPHFEFDPSVEDILNFTMPSMLTGFVYSALVDSFCCEQNARMTAMDAANQNAQNLLDELQLQYNYVRQGAITQEITEISSGAKGLAQKRKKNEGGKL